MAVSRSLASRPKLLPAPAPEDIPDVDDDEIDADEDDALARARAARRRPTSSTSTKRARPAPARTPPAKRSAPAKRSKSSSTSSRSSSSKPAFKVGGIAHDGSGVVLGMIAYSMFVAYVKHGGWVGVRKWIAAKFINQTTPAPYDPTAPGHGAGGSTITIDPKTGKITTVRPGPGDNQPQPGGTAA